MVFKSLNELAPKYMCNLFIRTSQLTSWNLRNSATDLRLPKKNSKNGQKCFSFRGAKTWNALSAGGKLASSLNTFKQCMQERQLEILLFYFISIFFYCKYLLLILGVFISILVSLIIHRCLNSTKLIQVLDVYFNLVSFVMEGPLKISIAEGLPSLNI